MPRLRRRLSAAGLGLAAACVAAAWPAAPWIAAGAAATPDDGGKPAEPRQPADPDSPPKDGAGKSDAEAVAKLTPEERARRLADAMERLSATLSKVRSVRARFVQTKRLEVFGRDVESKGTFALQAPDRFRWETTEPVRSVLVVRGAKGVRRRISRKGEATDTPFDLAKDPVTAATVEQVFLWTTGNFAKASASHELELVGESPLVVRAKPREERIAKVVRSVEVEFSGEPVHLTRVTLHETSGATSVLAFLDVEHDPELPPELFALDRTGGRQR